MGAMEQWLWFSIEIVVLLIIWVVLWVVMTRPSNARLTSVEDRIRTRVEELRTADRERAGEVRRHDMRVDSLRTESRDLASEIRRLDMLTQSLQAEVRDRTAQVRRLEADLARLDTRLTGRMDGLNVYKQPA